MIACLLLLVLLLFVAAPLGWELLDGAGGGGYWCTVEEACRAGGSASLTANPYHSWCVRYHHQEPALVPGARRPQLAARGRREDFGRGKFKDITSHQKYNTILYRSREERFVERLGGLLVVHVDEGVQRICGNTGESKAMPCIGPYGTYHPCHPLDSMLIY